MVVAQVFEASLMMMTMMMLLLLGMYDNCGSIALYHYGHYYGEDNGEHD